MLVVELVEALEDEVEQEVQVYLVAADELRQLVYYRCQEGQYNGIASFLSQALHKCKHVVSKLVPK